MEDFPQEAGHDWSIRRADVAQAFRMAGNSAPGPDGIPYSFLQACGREAVDVLYAALGDLQSAEADRLLREAYWDEDEITFNSGTLVFLPKKASGEDEHGCPVFLPADTRPLCIVDCSNRV